MFDKRTNDRQKILTSASSIVTDIFIYVLDASVSILLSANVSIASTLLIWRDSEGGMNVHCTTIDSIDILVR